MQKRSKCKERGGESDVNGERGVSQPNRLGLEVKSHRVAISFSFPFLDVPCFSPCSLFLSLSLSLPPTPSPSVLMTTHSSTIDSFHRSGPVNEEREEERERENGRRSTLSLSVLFVKVSQSWWPSRRPLKEMVFSSSSITFSSCFVKVFLFVTLVVS